MFKLIKDLTRPPESLTPPVIPVASSPTPYAVRHKTQSRSRSGSATNRDPNETLPLSSQRAKSPRAFASGREAVGATGDAEDSAWSFALDFDIDEDEVEQSAKRVVEIIRDLRSGGTLDVMRYVEGFSQLLTIPGDYYSLRAWRRHNGIQILLLALSKGLCWKPRGENMGEEQYQVLEVQRMEGIRLAFEVLGWALGDRLGEAYFKQQGGYRLFLPILYPLAPPTTPPNSPDRQILAHLFAHICSNSYAFLTLFQSPPLSLSDISSRLGDVLVRPSTSDALGLIWLYLLGESLQAKDEEKVWMNAVEGEEGSERNKLFQLTFQLFLVIGQASSLNLFILVSQLHDLANFLVTKLYGPKEKREYEITFLSRDDWLVEREEEEEKKEELVWRQPTNRLRSTYLLLLKKILEAGVDHKTTWRLFELVKIQGKKISTPPTEVDSNNSSSEKTTASPDSIGSPTSSAVFVPKNSTFRGKPNLYINTIKTGEDDEERLQPEVLDLIRHALKSKWPDVFVFNGGSADSLGGLNLRETGRDWMNAHKGLNFSCWIHITKLNQPLTLLHVSQKSSKDPLFQVRILESSQIAITTSVHSDSSSSAEPSSINEVVCSAPGALIPHFQWVHFAVGCHKLRGHESGEVKIFLNGSRVGVMRMPFPVPKCPSAPLPILPPGVQRDEGSSRATRIAIGKEYRGDEEESVRATERLGKEEENQWMLGRALLLEEAIPEDLVLLLHHLGPRYTGNLQEPLGKFLTYEGATSINIYLHGLAQLSKDKKLFTQQHSSSILVRAIRSGYVIPEESIVLSISAKDYDPLQDICINSSIPHPYRAKQFKCGIVKLTGNVRPFKTIGLDESVQAVGGGLVLLNIVSMSQTREELFSALSILKDAIRDNWSASEEMERIQGFDLLAAILRPKAAKLLDETCTKVVLAMLGINMDKPNTATVHNSVAYRSIGLEFELWSYASDKVIRYYLQHFEYLLSISKHKRFNNLRTFQKLATVRKMLYALRSGLFNSDVMPDVVDTLGKVLEVRWSSQDGIKPIFSYLVSALCQNNTTVSSTISGEPPTYQLPAVLILRKISQLCHSSSRLVKLIRSIALHRLLIIFLSSNSSYYVVLPCLNLLEHCFNTSGLEHFQKSFESEGGFALLARILPPIWNSDIQNMSIRILLGNDPMKKLHSSSMMATLLAALELLLQTAGNSEENRRPSTRAAMLGAVTSVKYVTTISSPIDSKHTWAPHTRLESLLTELDRLYRCYPAARKQINHKKIEAMLPHFADFAAISSNIKSDIIKDQREAAACWLSSLLVHGQLPQSTVTQIELLIEQLCTLPISPRNSSSLTISNSSPQSSSHFSQSFSSRLGTSTGVPSSSRRRSSVDAGMISTPAFTRSRSIIERKSPLKRTITGESILEGGKDKNSAWKMIIIQTVSENTGLTKQPWNRKEHWLKLSQFDWPQQAAVLRSENGLWPRKDERITWRLDGSEGPLRMRQAALLRQLESRLIHCRARLERIDDVPEQGLTRKRHKMRDAIPSADELSSAISQINTSPWEDPFALALGDTAPIPEEGFAILTAPDDENLNVIPSKSKASFAVLQTGEIASEENVDSDSLFEIDDGDNNRMKKIAKSLQPGDAVEEAHNIVRIVGVDACPGLLILGRKNLYLVDGLVQRSDGAIIDAKDAEKDVLSIPSGTLAELSADNQQSHCWQYNEIIENNRRAFLFRDVALELYFSDKRNFLIVFRDKRERQAVVQSIHSKNDHRDPISKSIIGNFVLDTVARAMDRSEQQLEAWQRKWQNREITNFAYLQLLNQYANRTPNDVTQYPVFPWVLADYTSDRLDLTSESSFRDLNFPMGAITEARREAATERYAATESVGEKPFHYGTHYSSSMIVCGYLIRLSPFTEIFLALQGGNFDLADRLFSSIPKAWSSASSDNRGDVRELIPEFFYSPAFLYNLAGFRILKQASGDTVDNVTLPPWALEDPHLFIHRHREALESEHVSRHLPSWIDLTFGYKQRDPASFNCFHPLSYRGTIDLENIEDEGEKAASTAIIHNFGQTPLQIFKSPHPRRYMTGRSDLPIGVKFGVAEHWQLMFRSILPITESSNPIDGINLHSSLDTKPRISQKHRLLVPGSSHLSIQYGFTDGSIRVYYQETLVLIIEGIYPEHAIFAAPSLFVTVSQGVIMAWRLTIRGTGHRRGDVTMQREASLRGHTHRVTCLCANTSWSLLVSGSEGGKAMVWDTNRLRYIRTLQTGRDEQIHFCTINEADGQIALASKRHLYLFTLNGHPLASTSSAVCTPLIHGDAVLSDSEEIFDDDFTGGISYLTREFLKDGTLFVIGVGKQVILYRCAPGTNEGLDGSQDVAPWELVALGMMHRSNHHGSGDCCMVKFVGETLYAAFQPLNRRLKYTLYQWSLPDGPARHVAESVSNTCMAGGCTRHFGLLEPKRHCGGCGGAFCGTHALHVEAFAMRYCDACRAQLSIASAQGLLDSRRNAFTVPSNPVSRRGSISHDNLSSHISVAKSQNQPRS
nr:hypothetical protein L203_01081 [Cryptococcus depauperatus CBS 7841]